VSDALNKSGRIKNQRTDPQDATPKTWLYSWLSSRRD